MASKPFPVPDSTTSFWRANPHPIDNHRSTETLPTHADILIIGAGYAGASCVHHLLESGKIADGKSVVVFEAREACSGATGRNGGHLKPDPYMRTTKALDLLDKAAADEVSLFEIRHLKEVGDLVKRDGIDCDFIVTQVTDVSLYDDGVREQKATVEKLRAHGTVGIEDVVFSEGERAEEVSGIKGAKSCLSHTAGHLYPYNLVAHMLSQAVKTDVVNLQTNTPVESVSEKQDDDGNWTVTTPRGSIKTPIVVFATNGYTSALIPEMRDKIVPVRGICSRIVSPKAVLPPLSTTSILRFNEYEYDYLIPRQDGSIIVGGARRDFYTKLDEWFNTYDDSKLIEPAKDYFDGYMQRLFIGWEDSEAFTESVWTGIMGYTDDAFPYVGDIPDKPGQYICAGYTGHGMSQIFLSSKAIAEMVVDGTRLEDTDLPRLYRASKERFEAKPEHASITAYKRVMEKLGLKN